MKNERFYMLAYFHLKKRYPLSILHKKSLFEQSKRQCNSLSVKHLLKMRPI
jgi:hypothetical protein